MQLKLKGMNWLGMFLTKSINNNKTDFKKIIVVTINC